MLIMNIEYIFQQVRDYVGSYNRYVERYIKFINSRIQLNKSRNVPKDQGHDHHVFPVSWGGNNDRDNLVRLTFKEHIIAHHILYYTNDPSMIAAFYSMCNIARQSDIQYNMTANQYQTLQEKMYPIKCANSKKNMSDPKVRQKISKKLKGRFVGEYSQHKRAVINTTTNEVFATARMADQKYQFKQGSVSAGLYGHYNVGGYHFEYLDEYQANNNQPTWTKQISSRFKGKKHSEQSKRKISETLKAQNRVPHNKKKILNVTTGDVYDSMCDVADKLGLNRTTLASTFYKARKQGKDTCKVVGYIWKVLDQENL